MATVRLVALDQSDGETRAMADETSPLRMTRRSLKGLDEEDYRRIVRAEIRRVRELSPPETMAFVIPSVTLETSSRSLRFMEALIVQARKELGNWHRQQNIRFHGAGKKQQANRLRDAEEFRICVAGVLILNGIQQDFAPFERIIRRSPETRRKV
jgi:hypothetical protein